MNISFIAISGGSWEIFNANLIAKNCFFGQQNQIGVINTNQLNKSMYSNDSAPDLLRSNSRVRAFEFFMKFIKATVLFFNTTFKNIHKKNSNRSIITAKRSQLHFSFSNISEVCGISSHFVHTNETSLKIENSIMERNNISSLIKSLNNSNITIENSIFIKTKVA